MQIINEVKLDFNDVLIMPKRSLLTSRSDAKLERTFKFKYSDITWTGIPIIAANMDSTGTFEMFHSLKKHKIFTALHKHYSEEELIEFFNSISEEESNYVFYTLGMSKKDKLKYEKVKSSINKKINFVCIDVPSAYLEKFVDFVKTFRKENPNIVLMVGNVCTGEMTEELILAGASIIKAGIGGGSGCLTRKVAGVGVPQLSCLIDCADHAHGLDGLVCSDGGIVEPGDLGKAFGANGDFVMMGGVFSGHDESGGEFIVMKEELKVIKENMVFSPIKGEILTKEEVDNLYSHEEAKAYLGKRFYGMSSYAAQNKHYGEIKEYRASEGRETIVPYKGSVENTLKEYLGGLRSTLSYVGAKNLKELSKRTTFVRVNRILNTSLEK